MTQLLNTPDDCQWLREGHLKGLSARSFDSFVIEGNEDSPTRIELYASVDPLITDTPVNVFEQNFAGEFVPAHEVKIQINVLAELQEAAEYGVDQMWCDVRGLQKSGDDTEEQEALAERWGAAVKKLENIK